MFAYRDFSAVPTFRPVSNNKKRDIAPVAMMFCAEHRKEDALLR
jgi:hypothetical protein